MPVTLDKPRPLHRERTPARRCAERGCGAWLASANEDDRCALHGGWSTQQLDTFDALGHMVGHGARRKQVGEALEELLEEAP